MAEETISSLINDLVSKSNFFWNSSSNSLEQWQEELAMFLET